MSVRSGRVVKTVRTLTRPALEAPCSYSSYNCSLTRLEGFEYCSRHILEDKGAPFRQCNYIFTSTGKRCFRAAPTNDRKESRYCPEHSRKSLVIKQRSARKMCPRETPERLLTQLSHHQMDVHTAGQNAIPDPASVPGMASVALEYASDTDSDSEMGALPNDTLARREADSELDSADSDADPLEHAQVFTTEEITRIYLEKLQKLKSLYVGEYKRLAHILRESRRKYVQAVRTEKETMCSIHSQPKPTPEERMAYEQLKAMARYQKHIGTHSLLYRQQMERRLQDPNQVLFVACGVSKGGGDECRTPVVCAPNSSTCVYHTPIPDPLPVSLPPLDDLDGNHTDMLDEELLVGGHLPTGGSQEIIDLSESHSFIVTEVPPENVMEGDGEDIEEVQGKDSKL
ncbi:KAT8 regulatory NSL complex subunit 2 isoform X3 [Macrobrachium rosenbergii]|uniref:KAT8 regulatory NSL complex subunit 2 isoform X3 n=1 Tax=Macrobrachium rosenbergii TaxID=79674 RepID=UPI0034D6D171